MMSQDKPFSRMLLVAGMAWVAASLVGAILYLVNQADISRRIQIEGRRLEAHAQDLSSIEWEAMARGEIRYDSLASFHAGELEMAEASIFIAEANADQEAGRRFKQACDQYVAKVAQELALIQAGRFDAAEQLDRTETDPRYKRLKEQIEGLNQEHSRAAERIVRTTKVGLILTTLLAMGFILYFSRLLEAQTHQTDMAVMEQSVLRQSQERFRALTNNAADLVIVTDREGRASYVSPSVQNVLGVDEAALIGSHLVGRVHPEDEGQLRAVLATVAAGRGKATAEVRVRHADESWRTFECVMRNLLDDPNVGGLLVNARDITLRKQAQDRLAFDAGHDALTKLPNRALFMDRLEMAVERSKRHPERVNGLLFIDIDDFKVVNDCLGHDAGDLLIAASAERLSNCLRRIDLVARSGDQPNAGDGQTVARLGGDEFTILLEDLTDPSDSIRVAQRIQQALSEPFVLGEQEIYKGASIGIAFTDAETSAAEVMAKADIAMYRAKNNGKCRCEIFDDAMHQQVTRRLELETALRRALERGEFRLFYQPIVSLLSEKVVGLEALLRWDQPGVGVVAPDGFIALAEEVGLIVPIGQWVLQEACREAASWRGQADSPLYVSINVSGRQFSYPGFVEQVRDAIAASQVNPAAVTLEITESTAMGDADRAEEVMRNLRELGVKLSIDDFGTGYSSLSSLRRFPLSTLKIDRSFVSTMHQNPQNCAIVNTIIALARQLEMNVVAEGIENVDQLEKLRSGCDWGQGYLFSRPIPAADVARFLRTHASGVRAAAGGQA